MTSRWRQAWLAAAIGLALLGARPATDPVARLERSLARTRDASARFVQTRRSPLLPDAETSRGRLWVRRPGEARLEYETPESLVFWKRSDTAWVYVPALRQLQVGPAREAGVPLGWMIGGTLAEVRRSARVRALGSEVEIVPDPGSGVPWSSVRVGFGSAGDFPDRYRFEEESGEVVEIRLVGVRWNRGVPARIFAPRVPEGTRRVDLGS